MSTKLVTLTLTIVGVTLHPAGSTTCLCRIVPSVKAMTAIFTPRVVAIKLTGAAIRDSGQGHLTGGVSPKFLAGEQVDTVNTVTTMVNAVA